MRFRLTEQEAQWANKLWVAYGCIVGVHFLAQLFSYWFLPYDAHPIEFYIHTLAIPTLQMAAVIFVAQAINQADSRYAFFTLFLAGTFVAVTLIRLNTDIRIISAVFLLPILASALFFRIWLTWFSAALQLLAFVGLYYGSASYRSMLTPFDIIAILCFIVFCAFLMTILMMRGRELYEQLRETLAVKEQLLAQNAAIHQRSKIDALTGLYNQATFHEYFEVAMEYGADPRGATAFHLAIVDIDDFKSINDTYGHRVGDLVLQRIAAVVREQLPTRDIAARYGGGAEPSGAGAAARVGDAALRAGRSHHYGQHRLGHV